MTNTFGDNFMQGKGLKNSLDIFAENPAFSDAELAALDDRLGSSVRRPSRAFAVKLNTRIFEASAGLLPVPVAIPFRTQMAPAAAVRTRLLASGWARFSLAASIMLACTLSLPLQISRDSDASTLAMAATFEADRPETETVLVALMQESSPRSEPVSVNVPQMSDVSPVLSTRNASYSDFEAEMSLILADDPASASSVY